MTTTSPTGNVLLCGAQGFIGQALAAQLRSQGFNVLAGSRRAQPAINFAAMQQASDWLPHLRGVDMVINAVGSLRDQPGPQGASLQALQEQLLELRQRCAAAQEVEHCPILQQLQVSGGVGALADDDSHVGRSHGH